MQSLKKLMTFYFFSQRSLHLFILFGEFVESSAQASEAKNENKIFCI